MLFAKISILFLISAGLMILAFHLIKPVRYDPLGVLGPKLIIFSTPLSLMFGIKGIVFDRKKMLAVIVTVVTGISIFFYLFVYLLRAGIWYFIE
jgi:hypothetical protein